MTYKLGNTTWQQKSQLDGSIVIFQSEQVDAALYGEELRQMGATPIVDDPEEISPPSLLWSKNDTNKFGTLKTTREFIDWATQITNDRNDLRKRVKNLEQHMQKAEIDKMMGGK